MEATKYKSCRSSIKHLKFIQAPVHAPENAPQSLETPHNWSNQEPQ
jgi:hypothetical protein